MDRTTKDLWIKPMSQPERSSNANQPSGKLTEKTKAKLVDLSHTHIYDPAYGLCASCKADWVSQEPELSRILSLGPNPKDPQPQAEQSVIRRPPTTPQWELFKVDLHAELSRIQNTQNIQNRQNPR